MLFFCPRCETGFHVAAEALSESGRMVRCALCRTIWFAVAETAAAEPTMAEATVDGAFIYRAIRVDDSAGWVGSPTIDIELIGVEPRNALSQSEIKTKRRSGVTRNSNRSKRPWAPRVAVAAIGMLGLAVTAVGSRATIVRIMPDLAGVYAAISIPVNLRGLEFREVKSTREMQDGMPVLAIEGEVVNVVNHAVEVPRVRLAVLGPNGEELYSWTTHLQRSILADNERVSFRSRLASPPPEGRGVLVRFLTGSDLAAIER